MHGYGTSNVNTHMIGIKISPYPVHCSYVASVACMDIGHLHNSYPLESGMVALDVAVVNANIITGENLFKKRSGLSRVKTNSSS